MSAELPFTGERFVPGARGEIWVEHWHRYHFAARWAAGRRVLDVACGEGYGAALLARTAAEVLGVDVSAEAVAHARAAYGAVSNLAFEAAPCTKLPLADASRDLVVSFETLEHIAEQEAFLDEVARVLAPEGVLVLSSPNKREYSDRRGFANEFHVKELYREELARLVAARFPHVAWYGQRPSFFSVIAPEAAGPAAGQLFEVEESRAAESSPVLANPLYFVLVASRSKEAIAALAPAVSVLADRDDWVHKDYEKVMRWLEECAARGESQRSRIAELEKAAAAAGAAHQGLERRVFELEGFLARRDDELALQREALARSEAEVRRRGGLRWWLRLPFHRLFGPGGER